MTGTLIDWTSVYPGDLADSTTQAIFRQILGIVLRYPFMAHLTIELVGVEERLPGVIDLDSSWARATSPETHLSRLTPSSASLPTSGHRSSSTLGGTDERHQWTHALTIVLNDDPRHFAAELTKMQWDLFEDIRVGHVGTS
jgi:hypothetical protein